MSALAASQPAGREKPLSKTARLMARHMATAWAAPMFGVTVEVAMEAATARRTPGVTLTDIILADVAATLKEQPHVNAHYRDDAIVEFDAVNVGLAVAAERGLTVPVIRDADTLSLTELAERRRELVGKVRDGRIAVADVVNGTFTVSNLGMFDVARFTAILNPPQVAILAVGSTSRRYVWNGGEPVWRDIAELTLTCDHRALDGAQAATFMAALKTRLEAQPA